MEIRLAILCFRKTKKKRRKYGNFFSVFIHKKSTEANTAVASPFETKHQPRDIQCFSVFVRPKTSNDGKMVNALPLSLELGSVTFNNF